MALLQREVWLSSKQAGVRGQSGALPTTWTHLQRTGANKRGWGGEGRQEGQSEKFAHSA